ncbi:hypothetical protein [Aureispira sp. CCB-E]|uniref:hypothetical protein n=1 Tax=Aureispira sp. CCB-E TaxID=3051121 RepID=UPI0028689E45|nr:hypothetical protein [Aureispira sp. CCB-E]WMX14700.1 hypothetical protein QP953_27975 [Aureispira sp. CCB-E]
MKTPMQSMPIGIKTNYNTSSKGITTSGIACTLCKTACQVLPIGARQLCELACDKTVC